jgi:translocation and assembly module TamA
MDPILNWTGKSLVTLVLVLAAVSAEADELRYAVTGVEDALRSNVLAHVETVKFGRQARLAERDFPKIIAGAERRAREGLRPYGYYAAEVTGRIDRVDSETLVLTLQIQPGPPLRVSDVQLGIVGAGRDIEDLREWRSDWPLRIGAVLNQARWEEEKSRAIDLAHANGFLGAEIREHALELDLDRNEARIVLVIDTGTQYVFGDIDFGEHVLKPGVLEAIPRFDKGDRYSRRMLDRFRIDLWQTGYFTNVEIREARRADTEPPQVDLSLTLLTDRKNVYQGSIGFGTDTGSRLQAQWSRHPMSRNGDRLDIGIGWQSQDDEITARANYRLPRLVGDREYWVAAAEVREENLDLEIKRSPEDENYLKIADGNIADYHLRVGNLRVRNFKQGDRQWFGTAFVQYLNSIQGYDPRVDIPELPGNEDLLRFNDDVISIGYDADLVDVRGKGFDVGGRRDRLYFFVSDKALGSDSNFKQAYMSMRRVYRRGDRLKLLVRGEIGYTDALVDNLVITVPTLEEPNGISVDLSVTRLPNFYRFKAGGSQSVRGYAFESLSNNDIGSNHIVTASIETEFRFLENWSAAAFFDIGNAFNDWDEADLRKGAGVGIRWYSIAGPIRVDVAQALDFEGKPWRIHFTIGTPLL